MDKFGMAGRVACLTRVRSMYCAACNVARLERHPHCSLHNLQAALFRFSPRFSGRFFLFAPLAPQPKYLDRQKLLVALHHGIMQFRLGGWM